MGTTKRATRSTGGRKDGLEPLPKRAAPKLAAVGVRPAVFAAPDWLYGPPTAPQRNTPVSRRMPAVRATKRRR